MIKDLFRFNDFSHFSGFEEKTSVCVPFSFIQTNSIKTSNELRDLKSWELGYLLLEALFSNRNFARYSGRGII